MLHLFGGWYCFLFPLYLWTAQLLEKIHSKDPAIAPWLTSWKRSSLSRYCCASWELLLISSQLRGWRPACWGLRCLQGRVWSPSCVVSLSADVFWSPQTSELTAAMGAGSSCMGTDTSCGFLLPHWFSARVTLWMTFGLYWSREGYNITSGSILLHWKTLRADCFIKAVTVLM